VGKRMKTRRRGVQKENKKGEKENMGIRWREKCLELNEGEREKIAESKSGKKKGGGTERKWEGST